MTMKNIPQASIQNYLSCEYSLRAGVHSGKHSAQTMLQQRQQQGKAVATPGEEMVEFSAIYAGWASP